MESSSAATGPEQDEDLSASGKLITTSWGTLDMLLKGGVKTGSVTELFWECHPGKSLLCHTLCVTCQLPLVNGGANGKALYIDTEGTFRPELLLQIADKFNGANVLEKVTYARAYDTSQQSILLLQAESMMEKTRFVLLVVDSATALYRTYYSDIGEPVRQNETPKFLTHLEKLAAKFGVAVVITNQVVDQAGISTMIPSPRASTTRLILCKGEGQERIWTVRNYPFLDAIEASFQLPAGFKEGTVNKKGDDLVPCRIISARQLLLLQRLKSSIRSVAPDRTLEGSIAGVHGDTSFRKNHMVQNSSAKCKVTRAYGLERFLEINDRNRLPIHLVTGSRIVDQILGRNPDDQFRRAAFEFSGPDLHPSSRGVQRPWCPNIIDSKVPKDQEDYVYSKNWDLAEQLESADNIFEQVKRKMELNSKANVSWLWELIDDRLEIVRSRGSASLDSSR